MQPPRCSHQLLLQLMMPTPCEPSLPPPLFRRVSCPAPRAGPPRPAVGSARLPLAVRCPRWCPHRGGPLRPSRPRLLRFASTYRAPAVLLRLMFSAISAFSYKLSALPFPMAVWRHCVRHFFARIFVFKDSFSPNSCRPPGFPTGRWAWPPLVCLASIGGPGLPVVWVPFRGRLSVCTYFVL